MWSTGKKEVHLLRATRTTQTWQRPPALPYAHLRAHLQKSPASCCVFVPGWIKPIGSTPRCVSGCVHPNPPSPRLHTVIRCLKVHLLYCGLWKGMEPDCVLASNCSFGFKRFSLYVFREANMGVYAPLYTVCNIYICMYNMRVLRVTTAVFHIHVFPLNKIAFISCP